MFGSWKILRKEKMLRKMILMFMMSNENVKENQIYIKLFRNLSILKLFNIYNDTCKINKMSLKY